MKVKQYKFVRKFNSAVRAGMRLRRIMDKNCGQDDEECEEGVLHVFQHIWEWLRDLRKLEQENEKPIIFIAQDRVSFGIGEKPF